MGCWGHGIMQSDDALDAEIDIFDAVDLSWEERSKKKIAKAFIIGFDSIAKICDKYKDIDNYSHAVYWQVLAYHGMKNGVQFNQDQQKQIIEGISICEDYQNGKKYPNESDLHTCIKEQYIKDFGVADWEQREGLWGEGSLTQRVINRTKNIEQLIEDFKTYNQNGCLPFERKEDGLMETFQKKVKM